MASVCLLPDFLLAVKKEVEIAICESVKPNVLYFCNGSLLSCFVVKFQCFSGQFEEKVTFGGDM